MLYVFGVNHCFQVARVDPERLSGFKNELIAIFDEYKIQILAEEFSIEALKANDISKSVPYSLLENRIESYLLVDPDKAERKLLKIRSRDEELKSRGVRIITPKIEEELNQELAADDRLREIEWFRRMKPYTASDILLVCGFQHVESFVKYAFSQGCQVCVLESNFISP